MDENKTSNGTDYDYWKEEAEKWHKKNKWYYRLIFTIRIILFPIMLIVRLFRWTYHYD